MLVKKRHSIRFRKLDYSLPNKFFVTMCALRHGCYFGKYPELTELISTELHDISNCFPNVSVEAGVIMPNHIHLIISINYKIEKVTLGKIINVLKGKTINKWLKIIKENDLNAIGCVWQRNYFERRIRNKTELDRFKIYIKNNPTNWLIDKYNPENLNVGASLAEAHD